MEYVHKPFNHKLPRMFVKKVIVSTVEREGLEFSVATVEGKLVACTVPNPKKDSREKIMRELTRLFKDNNFETLEAPIDSSFVDAIWHSYAGLPHGLKMDDIAFDYFPKGHVPVLKSLFKIKIGIVITYAELAQASGLTKRHARYVGNIMANNPLPLIIPCHRVIQNSGRLGNYSGGEGVKTKRELLKREGISFSH